MADAYFSIKSVFINSEMSLSEALPPAGNDRLPAAPRCRKILRIRTDVSKLLLTAVESLLLHRPFCTRSCLTELERRPRADGERHHELTAREQLVVKLVSEGYSNKGISAILNLSVKTTEAHRAAAMRKLEVNSTAGLVRYAVRSGLVEA